MKLSKIEAIKKVKVLKVFIEILYDTFPANPIPWSYWDKGREVVYYTSPPPVYFYFEFFATGIFCLHCTNYCVWRDPEYQALVKDLKKAAEDEGFEITDCYSYYGNIYSLRKYCAEKKLMLIEKPKSDV